MKTIFDLVTSQAIVGYWEEVGSNKIAYLGEELFPETQQLGLELKWLKGSKGLPVVLKPSAYDVAAVSRSRIGFDKVSAEIPFFKESMKVDEEDRQRLNMVLQTGNQAYIDAVMNKVFDDEIQLIEGARAQRERMRMMLLTTGVISISANGQAYDYDYGMPEENKVEVETSWSDPNADIYGDIKKWQNDVYDRTGVKPTRAIFGSKVWGYITKNTAIRNAILGNTSAVPVSDNKIVQYLKEELQLTVVEYNKKYVDEKGTKLSFVPDDVFTLFPEGNLGRGVFGTTPEQSDLMSGTSANVSITDLGVAVTTMKLDDPVNVETKVTMSYLPSFESIDEVVIADVIKE